MNPLNRFHKRIYRKFRIDNAQDDGPAANMWIFFIGRDAMALVCRSRYFRIKNGYRELWKANDLTVLQFSRYLRIQQENIVQQKLIFSLE